MRGVWLASLDTPSEPHRLVSDTSVAMYASGRLLFVRNGALMAQPLNLARGQPDQEAVALIDDIGFVGVAGSHSFSVSETGHLAYVISSGERRRLTWLDRRGSS